MHRIMTELHEDHVNLTKLLRLLEQQVERLAAGKDADLLLMTDIADYIRRYADQVHHPKEDVVYQVFKSRSTEAGKALTALLEEHQQLPAITLEFERLLDSLINDSVILSREELSDRISTFIAAQKVHLNTEETGLFPLIEATLQVADWQAVENIWQEHSDPLFGGHILDRYRNLQQLIGSQPT